MRWICLFALSLLSACATMQKPVAEKSARVAMQTLPVYTGWAAISGGGPQARANNTDWHMQNDLHLQLGNRVPLHWRDGANSGYSLELARRNYPGRNLVVLQLDVIEDATGKSLAYAWADSNAGEIGLNLGWLQVGLQAQTTAAGPKK
ncbi:MAG: hypothetical protein ACREPT_09340 [Rudaea sp.]